MLVRTPAVAVTGIALVVFVAGRRFRDWGATKGECEALLPGDELIPEPADVMTRAVTVELPTAQKPGCAPAKRSSMCCSK